jgi:hypothetical protein
MGILLVYDVTDESSFNSNFSICLCLIWILHSNAHKFVVFMLWWFHQPILLDSVL